MLDRKNQNQNKIKHYPHKKGRTYSTALWDPILLDGTIEVITDARITSPCVTDACITNPCMTDACMTDAYMTDSCITDACIPDACMTDACIIIPGANKESRTSGEEQTPLFYAARNDASKALAVLIKNNCEFKDIKDYRGRTPLYVAAELGKISGCYRQRLCLIAETAVMLVYLSMKLFTTETGRSWMKLTKEYNGSVIQLITMTTDLHCW